MRHIATDGSVVRRCVCLLPSDVHSKLQNIIRCANAAADWMSANRLQLKCGKTAHFGIISRSVSRPNVWPRPHTSGWGQWFWHRPMAGCLYRLRTTLRNEVVVEANIYASTSVSMSRIWPQLGLNAKFHMSPTYIGLALTAVAVIRDLSCAATCCIVYAAPCRNMPHGRTEEPAGHRPSYMWSNLHNIMWHVW